MLKLTDKELLELFEALETHINILESIRDNSRFVDKSMQTRINRSVKIYKKMLKEYKRLEKENEK